MSKEIAGFFDSVDNAKKTHEKKKNSLFASANEEAMDTWMQKQQAIEAEKELRELIVNTRGFSAYQDLLKLRREIAKERKERERKEAKQREEQQELIAIIMVVLVFVIGMAAAAWWMLDHKGFI